MRRVICVPLFLLLILIHLACFQTPHKGIYDETRQKYRQTIEQLTGLITREMEDNNIPSLAIALVDGRQIIWSSAFGYPDPDEYGYLRTPIIFTHAVTRPNPY